MNERTRLKQKQYRIDHKEEIAAKKKIYDLENKERIYEYTRMRWANIDVEEKKERDRLHYLANKETINARLRERRSREIMQPARLQKDMLMEFKSMYYPWFEGHVKGVYQIDFD